MIKNYIKIAWRSLKTNRLFSAVNILGLALGLATTLLLFLFILHERSFDSMYAKKDRIYRVLLHTTEEGIETWAQVPSALSPQLTEHIPSAQQSGRLLKNDYGGNAFIKAGDNILTESKLFWIDPSILDMFDVNILSGMGAKALTKPNTILLSKSTAKRYFGSENPLGKTLTVDNRNTFEVKGIFEDFSEHSSLQFNAVVPIMMRQEAKHPSWGNASFETFVMLNSDTGNLNDIDQKLQNIIDSNVEKEQQWYTFSLQPLEQIHLQSSAYTDSYLENYGDISQIKNLTILGILILIIACINYMNLITARSQKKAKDVGVNKTLGASRTQLILRFYVETGLITAIAMILGGLFTILILPSFNNIVNRNLEASSLFSLQIFVFLGFIWLVTTLISGSYPALYLSRFSPKDALKPTSNKGIMASFIRKGLVVVQFSASVVLIVSVLVVRQQLEFVQNKNLGFNPEQVIAISTTAVPDVATNHALVNAFKKLPNVSLISRAQGYPTVSVSLNSIYKPNSDVGMSVNTNLAEHNIVDILQLKLLAGQRLPSHKQDGDSLVEVLINKTALDFLGYTPEEAIGKKVEANLGNNSYIYGVVDDFNFASLHKPVGAYAFHNTVTKGNYNYLLVRFKNQNLATTVSEFERTFKSIATTSAFQYAFVDKNVEHLYQKEQQMAKVSLLFSILAIIVACLGLFALAAYMAEQRQKEIGVRKVFGASVPKIVQLLSIDFMKLVLISFAISFPLALYIMNQWLQDFAYRVTISWKVFLITGCLVLLITFITVSYQAIKAAIANPINSLRTE
ncbi:ABC transporter permease [Formosa algae]|uniref:ABC-type antimicrobial peptide transport system permease subunit n=1 Tax=Formosa algae TaxID=225843 RepID=A0A9X0YMU7_9FLAO|nr:ABC transporter permease [Formosa algae]MBP1840132.1 ABC-type antimicrobial peptide transport system permease subunit [Formosa algae]MDQ0335732.1 ABC-type antimicrobial peptide transport system permease subunit [Formosa algae]OEI79772.1 cell division protein FtsX [Formosa algae]